jgi:hypothetical protein
VPPFGAPPFVVPPFGAPPFEVPPFVVPPFVVPPLVAPPVVPPPVAAPPVAELVPETPAAPLEPPASVPPPSLPLFEQATKPAVVLNASNHAGAPAARPLKRTNDDISHSSVLGTMATRARGRIPRDASVSLAARV